MIVAKFGGSTLSSYKAVKKIVNIIKSRYNIDDLIVVVSAFKGITDMLLKIAYSPDTLKNNAALNDVISFHKKLMHNLDIQSNEVRDLLKMLKQDVSTLHQETINAKKLDRILSYGERLSSLIVCEILKKNRIDAVRLEPKDIGFYTDDNYGSALPLAETEQYIRESILKYKGVKVITGFIGITTDGNITTLGRNGTDFTASYIGYSISADEVHFWKDVSSVYNANPEIIKNSKKIAKITYTQLELLSYFGSKIIHPPTLHPLYKKNIPARVLSLKHPEEEGTLITSNSDISNFFLSTETDVVKMVMRGYLPSFRKDRFEFLKLLNNLNIRVYVTKNLEGSTTVIYKDDPRVYRYLNEFNSIQIEYKTGLNMIAIGSPVSYLDIMNKILEIFEVVEELYMDHDLQLVLALLPDGIDFTRVNDLYSYLSSRVG